jgi:hypothetical protein
VVFTSQWKRSGSNIYYNNGCVDIGTSTCYDQLSVNGNFMDNIWSNTSASGGWALEGLSAATSGAGQGVHGESVSTDSADACGVYGYGKGLGSGVQGYTDSATGHGVYGKNDQAGGTAIYGLSSATSGYGCEVVGKAYANNDNSDGVYGSGATGVYGTGDVGVSGFSSEGDGVAGNSNHIGVIGGNLLGSGYGYGVYCVGDFAVANGTKNAIVRTSLGNRKTYSQESPEVWFEDFGEGQLTGGAAHIALDPLFLETVTVDKQHPMKVFIQLNGDCNGVYVQRGTVGFEVRELRGGTSNARFTYRVVAKRKGYENVRLEPAGDLPKPPILTMAKK